jgi:hypothetical protein
MKANTMILTAITAILLIGVIAVAPVAAQKPQDVLKTGEYVAGVKAITCGGCGPLIKKTMEGMKEIESVTVDSQKKAVHFAVKKDATVKVGDLQKALDAAAQKMGMGADYTLMDLKPAK